jgi:hypothetical protein
MSLISSRTFRLEAERAIETLIFSTRSSFGVPHDDFTLAEQMCRDAARRVPLPGILTEHTCAVLMTELERLRVPVTKTIGGNVYTFDSARLNLRHKMRLNSPAWVSARTARSLLQVIRTAQWYGRNYGVTA